MSEGQWMNQWKNCFYKLNLHGLAVKKYKPQKSEWAVEKPKELARKSDWSPCRVGCQLVRSKHPRLLGVKNISSAKRLLSLFQKIWLKNSSLPHRPHILFKITYSGNEASFSYGERFLSFQFGYCFKVFDFLFWWKEALDSCIDSSHILVER